MSFPLINPYQQFVDSSGNPLASGTIEFRDPTTNDLINSYPTADDADAQTNANANPLTLNASGAAASGLFLEDGVAYKVTLKDVNANTVGTWDDVRSPIALPYLRTAAETTAGVTPSDVSYPEGDVRRYGATGDGTTNDRAAFVTADSIGVEVIVSGGLDYVIGTSLTMTNPVRIDPFSTIKPSSGATVTLNGGLLAIDRESKVTGDGTLVIGIPQPVWVDWWDKTSLTCAQDALDNTAQGTLIQAAGRYDISGITVDADEDAGTGDQGKSFVGISGSPGTRLNPGTWGAEFVLDTNAGDADVLYFNGTDRGGNNGSRISFTCRGIKFDGNKIRVSGTATSGGTDTLSDSAAAWTTDQWINFRLKITAGTGAGQYGIIRSNTATQITISHDWGTAPDSTSQYQIESNYRRDTGTATGGGATTITDTSKNWVTNTLVGMKVRVLSGTGIGSNATISSNTDTVITVDTAWATNPASGSVYIVEATKASGINLNLVKDIWLENVYCANNGVDGIRASEGSVNQLHMDYVEVWANGRDGLGFGAIGDYTYGIVKSFINDRNGFQAAAGNAQGNSMHCYLNKGHGCTLSAANGIRHFSSIRSTDNVQAGVNLSGDENFIGSVEVGNNGRALDPSGANGISASANGFTGTATSGSTTTIVDTSQTWETNLYAGEYAYLTESSPPSGNAQWDEKLIDSNNATTLTLNSALSNPITTDKYGIGTQQIERANISARSANSQNNWIGVVRSDDTLDVVQVQYDVYSSGAAASNNVIDHIIRDGNSINGIVVDSTARASGHRYTVQKTVISSTTTGTVTLDKSNGNVFVFDTALTGAFTLDMARVTDAADGEIVRVLIKDGNGQTIKGTGTNIVMPISAATTVGVPLVIELIYLQGVWYGQTIVP